MARRTRHAKGGSRDAGGFCAIPWQVLDSPAWASLSHRARALLLEVARQYHGDDNGRMLLSRKYLAGRGWNSVDGIQTAKRELLEAGFIHETVMGCRPNKASWYACTWMALDRHEGYDSGAALTFRRGAYRDQNASLVPPAGTAKALIAPPGGTGRLHAVPPDGAMRRPNGPLPVPPAGHPLEPPSPGTLPAKATTACATRPARTKTTNGRPATLPATADRATTEAHAAA